MAGESVMVIRKRKYWYFQTIEECCLCGKTRIFRERRYGRKPVMAKRYRYTNALACDWHFL